MVRAGAPTIFSNILHFAGELWPEPVWATWLRECLSSYLALLETLVVDQVTTAMRGGCAGCLIALHKVALSMVLGRSPIPGSFGIWTRIASRMGVFETDRPSAYSKNKNLLRHFGCGTLIYCP